MPATIPPLAEPCESELRTAYDNMNQKSQMLAHCTVLFQDSQSDDEQAAAAVFTAQQAVITAQNALKAAESAEARKLGDLQSTIEDRYIRMFFIATQTAHHTHSPLGAAFTIAFSGNCSHHQRSWPYRSTYPEAGLDVSDDETTRALRMTQFIAAAHNARC